MGSEGGRSKAVDGEAVDLKFEIRISTKYISIKEMKATNKLILRFFDHHSLN